VSVDLADVSAEASALLRDSSVAWPGARLLGLSITVVLPRVGRL
jgi:hypothetical protein